MRQVVVQLVIVKVYCTTDYGITCLVNNYIVSHTITTSYSSIDSSTTGNKTIGYNDFLRSFAIGLIIAQTFIV